MDLFKTKTPLHEALVNVSDAMGDVVLTILDDLCILEEFETNYKNLKGGDLADFISKTPPVKIITTGFSWLKAPEGYKFWMGADSQYKKRILTVLEDLGRNKFKLD